MTDSWKSYVLVNHICIWYLQIVWLSCWEYSWSNNLLSRSWLYESYQLAYEGVEELTDLWLNIFVGFIVLVGPSLWILSETKPYCDQHSWINSYDASELLFSGLDQISKVKRWWTKTVEMRGRHSLRYMNPGKQLVIYLTQSACLVSLVTTVVIPTADVLNLCKRCSYLCVTCK